MPLPEPPPRKSPFVVIAILALLAGGVLLFTIALKNGWSLSSWVRDLFEIKMTSASDQFHVSVLETEQHAGHFMARVRIQCEQDMTASIYVTDLNSAGFFPTNSADGKIIYYELSPRRVGGSQHIRAKGKYSTCEVVCRVTTEQSKTIWNSSVGTTSVSTSLSTALQVSDVQTNWSGPYNRGSSLPLASLGDYKILITVK